VVSEHDPRQLWATLITEEGQQNITYRRRRYRSLEGREEEMEDTPGKNANLTEDREDGLIKEQVDLALGTQCLGPVGLKT
jgi:hypothetical protein